MTFEPHSARKRRSRTVHRINRVGYSTLCEKDPARTIWTDDWARVTCVKCLAGKPNLGHSISTGTRAESER